VTQPTPAEGRIDAGVRNVGVALGCRPPAQCRRRTLDAQQHAQRVLALGHEVEQDCPVHEEELGLGVGLARDQHRVERLLVLELQRGGGLDRHVRRQWSVGSGGWQLETRVDRVLEHLEPPAARDRQRPRVVVEHGSPKAHRRLEPVGHGREDRASNAAVLVLGGDDDPGGAPVIGEGVRTQAHSPTEQRVTVDRHHEPLVVGERGILQRRRHHEPHEPRAPAQRQPDHLLVALRRRLHHVHGA
jgi:hypothetical protein